MKNIKIIPHSRPFLGEEEIVLAGDVIRSGMIAQGKKAAEFETAFCRNLGYDYAAAVSSGTAAIHVALLAIGIQPGDEVIFPSFVCASLLHAVRYAGAIPVVADIDPDTCNIDSEDVQARMTPRTKAMIVPHMFGLPADMDQLAELKIPIIEDCAQALGASYNGKPAGTYGKAAVFSFYATKVMTTGEGGMAASSSDEFIEKIKDLRQYDGKNDDRVRYNYKMTDIQAAIGLIQLGRLPAFIERRREIARQYSNAFHELDMQLPVSDPGHIYYRYIIRLCPNQSPMEWIRRLRSKGVQAERPVFMPVHRYLRLTGYSRTEDQFRRLISIPLYPVLTQNEVSRVICAVKETFQETSGGR